MFLTLLASMIINIAMFIPAFYFKTDKLTDISYAATFGLLALYGFLGINSSIPHAVLTIMILLWSFRLGSYLLQRILKIGKDDRFDERRNNFIKFLKFWLLQGFTVWVVFLSSTIFYQNYNGCFTTTSYIGIVIWGLGFVIEAIADKQKYDFINNPKNKGKWINTGLWKYSRHPNYFGEILHWIGIYVYTLPGLQGINLLVGAISPIYIFCLLMFVSGIPLLEKSADKKWGKNPNYKEYRNRTSLLIPFPPKKS